MKNLIKKLKKTNKAFRYSFYLVLVLNVISVFFITKGLLLLTGIETTLRYFAIGLFAFISITYFISGLVFLILKKHAWFIIFTIFIVLLSAVSYAGYYYIDKTYNYLDSINKNELLYTTNLIALKDQSDINKVGMIDDQNDIEGYILPDEYIKNKQLNYEIVKFEDYYEMLDALYKKEIDALFITSNYTIIYNSNDKYEKIEEETYVIAEYSKMIKSKDMDDSTNKSVTEPFSLLIIGVDSKYNGIDKAAAFNGDSLMLVTFNPKTLSATVFSLPRDTYVPIACRDNKANKINSAAAYGTKCIVNTIEQLVGFEIDYNIKINFKGMVALVDALGGIEVEVPVPDYPAKYCIDNSDRKGKSTCLTPGKQILDGERALALARVRKAFATGDFKRVQNQQLVVEAIAKKAKTIRSVNDFYRVLNAISNNIDTNMSTKQMLNFYNVGKNILAKSKISDSDLFNIQKTYLTGYDANVYLPGGTTYTFQYYEESLNEIINAMLINLGEKEPEIIKTFNFSANETYDMPVIGKRYTSGQKKEVLPSFVGQSYNYLLSWNESRKLNITKVDSESNTCINGEIINQSVHKNTLVESISSMKVTVCKNITGSTTTTTTTKPIDETIEKLLE